MDFLNEIPLFVEVAQCLSFSRAAAKLNMPQSSLSRRIRTLEQALGVQLFNRSTHQIRLTEAGQRYLQRAAPLVEEARLLHDELSGRYARPGGVLRLSLPVDFAYEFLSPLLPQFAAQFPEIVLEMDVSPRRVDLVSEPFDVAVCAGMLPDSGLVAHRLLQSPRYLYAAPGYLRAQGAPESPAAGRYDGMATDGIRHSGDGRHWRGICGGQPRSVAAACRRRDGHRAVAGAGRARGGRQRSLAAGVVAVAGGGGANPCTDDDAAVTRKMPLFY